MMGMVYGLANNDAPYVTNVEKRIDGKRVLVWRCPFYKVWMNMLKRAYSPSEHAKRPTYKVCEVCEDWLTFSKFKSWMEQQDWEGRVLDKDVITFGNNIYSPENCAFISNSLNSFLTNVASIRDGKLVGAFWHKEINKYVAHCRNPFNKKSEYLGTFSTAHEAHEAWLKRKSELCIRISKNENSERISDALIRLSAELLQYAKRIGSGEVEL